jgi:hypothetical protein
MSKGREPGIVSLILGLVILWAVLFGITCGGSLYSLKCTPERGVEIIKEKAPDYEKE